MTNQFFDVTKIIGAISASGGYTRPTWYEAIITPPQKLIFNAGDADRITMNCMASQLKGKRFETKRFKPGGVISREVTVEPIFEAVELTFYLSADLIEKRFFDAWQALFYDPATGGLNYMDGVTAGDIATRLLGTLQINKPLGRGTDSTKYISYFYDNCWPIMVGDVRNSYGEKDHISEISVTMSYWQSRVDMTNAQVGSSPY